MESSSIQSFKTLKITIELGWTLPHLQPCVEQELDVLFQYYVLLIGTITALFHTCTVFFKLYIQGPLFFKILQEILWWKNNGADVRKRVGSKADSFSSHCEIDILLLCRFLKHFGRHHCKTKPFLPFLPMLFHLW